MRCICILFVIASLLYGCKNATERTIDEYNETFDKVSVMEQMYEKFDMNDFSALELCAIYNTGKELSYNYDPMGLDAQQVAACEALKLRVEKLRNAITDKIQSGITDFKITSWKNDDMLFETTHSFPIYLKRGEKLYWTISAQKRATVKIINIDSRKILKTYTGKTSITDSLIVENSAIYLVEINPNGVQYIGFDIKYKVGDISRFGKATKINVEEVACNRGDFGAKPLQGITMQKLFEEPRKFTLRSQFKALFSGGSKALVVIQVPAGATDILYSIRIATSEQDRSEDGEFYDNLSHSYKKVKMLGLPLYEKEQSKGLFSTLLDDNRPIREEDAYCNMYVFRNMSQAKQFQDGTKSENQLNYDVDYSTIGTQSCNGRIPAKGANTIYLAFENERVRYTNYLWVEAVAVVPKTEYYKTKYSVK